MGINRLIHEKSKIIINSLKSSQKSFKGLFLSVEYIFKKEPLFSSIVVLLNMINAASPIVVLYITKEIINILASSHSVLSENISSITSYIIFYILFSVINDVSTSIQQICRDILMDKLVAHSELNLLDKVNKLQDLTYFETPKFYDELRNAQAGCGTRFITVINSITGLIRQLFTIFVSSILLVNMNVFLGIVIILGVLPSSIYGVWSTKNRASIFRTQAEDQRYLQYYKQVLIKPETAKEARIFQFEKYFINKYKNKYSKIFKKMNKFRKKSSIRAVVSTIVTSCSIGGAFAWLCFQAVYKNISIGDTVLYIGLIPKISGAVGAVLFYAIQLFENTLYTKHFFDFLNLPSFFSNHKKNGDIAVNQPIKKGVVLNNISFKYEGADKFSLKNISLSIPVGKTIAIVGPNGSGKSTLIKVLLHLYKPTEGRISLDGIDYGNYDLYSLRSQFSVVFQDYAKYWLSVEENIKLGDISDDNNIYKIEKASKSAQTDIFIKRLSNAYKTILGKQFKGGTDLSIGQWQKLALARSFYRDANIVILDEPTSSMDAEAEYDLFQRFRELIGSKTGVIISHRFSNVRMADLIYVLNQGVLVESGTHSELMFQRGLYYKLFSMQAEGYIRDT